MGWRFDGTPDAVAALVRTVSEIPEIQRTFVDRHPAMERMDRAAHQQQLAAGHAVLHIGGTLPAELEGLGLFRPGTSWHGIARISTGLGCPHLETDPDFLGLMLSFRTAAGERVDFLAINDPSAPTDTAEEFLALLAATAASAGVEIPFGDVGQLDLGNLTAAQAKLFGALVKRLSVMRATAIYLHLARQTARTAVSSSAVQQYWTGVVDAGATFGKFTFVPETPVNAHRQLHPGPRHLSTDWEQRNRAGDIGFRLRWIPYLSEAATSLEELSEGWAEGHAVDVGSVRILQADPASREARLVALLASEMGANPGHWVSVRDGEQRSEFPATTFAAARQKAYALSQAGRGALPEDSYREFFESGGRIGPELERELSRRQDEQMARAATPR